MPPQYIQEIERLADKFTERNVTLYFPDFDAAPAADSLHQVFGAPVGVAADNWPVFPKLATLLREMSGDDEDIGGDLRMEHVLTLDLRGLTGIPAPAGARAMQLYISNAGYNEAWEPGTSHTRVVFLSEADVAAGPFTGELPTRSQRHGARRFTLVPVTVPGEVFFSRPEDDSPLAALRSAIWKAPARIGGQPIWLQGNPDEDEDYSGDEDDSDEQDDDDDDDSDEQDDDDSAKPRAAVKPLGLPATGDGFVMQFDESFADVNLGDSGIMYVTAGDAHFQCY